VIKLYISKSDSCGQSFESISITTFFIKDFLSSKYQEISQSSSCLSSFQSFANQYPGKSVKIYLFSTKKIFASLVFQGLLEVFTKSFF